MRASSLPLLLLCYGSALLPSEPYASEEAERARDWGKLVHAWVETGKTESIVLTKAIEKSGVNRLALWPDEGRHEISLALRVDGSRDVKLGAKPYTDLLPQEWITGSADYSFYIFDGELWIDDLKTGKLYPDEDGNNRFPQDVTSPQLRFYALALAKALEYHGVVHISLTHWPRLPVANRHSLPERYWVSYTEDEQEAFYISLELMYTSYAKDLADRTVETSPGDHCRFCPSRNWCLFAKTDFPSHRKY